MVKKLSRSSVFRPLWRGFSSSWGRLTREPESVGQHHHPRGLFRHRFPSLEHPGDHLRVGRVWGIEGGLGLHPVGGCELVPQGDARDTGTQSQAGGLLLGGLGAQKGSHLLGGFPFLGADPGGGGQDF
jgi:hypothetical protein